MSQLRELAAKIIGRVVGGGALIYITSCSFAAVYFHWQYARTHSFTEWLFTGDVTATLKGVVWPYYFLADRGSVPKDALDARTATASSEPLTHDELQRFPVPSLTHGPITPEDLTKARDILFGHIVHTGQRLSKEQFYNQIGWMALYLEWEAELTASTVLSWDSQAVLKTKRYVELCQALLKYDRAEEVSAMDFQIVAASKREHSFENEGYKIPLDRNKLISIEQMQREVLTSFNKFVENISDLLQ